MQPIVVIGLDGATWDVILPLVKAGRLPALGRLMEEGSWGKLRSVMPPLSPPAWASFMTGANPGKTRIFDFVGRADDGAFRLVNGQWRALPSLWRLLSDAGRRVAVINVPMTYPPEQVNGMLISGMDAPVKDKPVGYPEDIGRQLAAAGLPYRVEVHAARLVRESPERFTHTYVQQVNKMTAEHGAVARWAWDKLDPDFLMVTFVNTDRIGHAAGRRLKDFANEAQAAHLPDDHPIVATYRTADEQLGLLLEKLPPDATVIVMSDHGFQPYDQVFNLNYWLKEQGWLSLDESKLRRSRWGALAPLWKRLQYRLRGYGKRNLLTQAKFFRAIDWTRTRAYSFGAFGSIFVNLQGRDPYGIVKPGQEYEDILDRLTQQLLALRDPETGTAIVQAVHRADQVYSGPYVRLGPDLLLETAPGYFVRNALDEYRPQLLYPAGRYGDRSLEHTGMHHPDGIVILYGPHVRAGHQERVSILDVAPTILALAGVPVPTYMDGRPLETWFDTPLRWEARAGDDKGEGDIEGYSAEEEALIAEHLRDLGYL